MRKILLYPRLLLIFLCLLIVKINFTDGAESRFSLHTIPSAENERKGLLSSAGDASSHQSAHVHGFGRRQLNDLSVLSQPTFAPTQFIPTPSINSASLSPDGRFFTMTFDSATNKGGSNSNSFVCSSFLQFTKNDVATCLWQDASTIAVYPDFSTADNVDGAVNVGSLVQLLSPNNIYSVLCDVKNLNPACNPASAQTLFLLGPTNPVAPSVSVVIPKTVSACSPLLVDLTGCSGDGQRGWKSIDIKVTADNNNAQPAQIASYLTSKFTTKSPISVPSSLLTVDTNYVVTVELCNLLYGCTKGSTQFTVNSGSTSAPIVSLVGSTAASVFAKTPVSVTAPAYVVGCGGTTTSVGLTYSWQVLVGTTAVQVNQVVRGNSLSIPAFVLQTGQTYTIQVTVTDKGSGLKSTASTTFTVQVSALVANVNPSSMQLLRVGKSLTFNGGSSFDPDDINNDNGNLQYAWSCAGYTLNGRPNPDCALTLSSSVTSPTLTVTAKADAVNSTSTITLRVLKDKRNTTTSIRVKVIEGSAPLITIQTGTAAVTSVNTANSLLISGLVQSEFDVTCAWSVSPSTIILDKASLTGTTKLVTGGSPTLANLFLAGNSLGVRSTYVFTLSCLRSAATITVTTNGPPVGGLYSISPDTGIEMQQLFSATTSQWSDPDLPITYLFGFISPSNGLISTIQSRSSLAYAAGTLPGGKSSDAYLVTTVVYAFDALNSSAILNEAVAVTPLPEADVANTIASKLNATKGSTNLNDLKAVISVASSVISRVNCAAAPASLCASLNRANCSATAGTCGACLDGFAGQQGDANTKCVNSASGTPPQQQCNPSDCSGHGTCKFYDRTTALEISSCSVLASCDPKCVCSSGFYGTSCALTASQLQDQQGLRSDLLTSLSYVIENEDTTAETVNNVVSSIAGIIQSANDVNTESVNTFSTIAQTTLTNAAGDSSITADSLSGLLGPTDAAIKAQTASSGADSALALGNSIISSYSTIVNRDAVAGLPATTLVYDNFRFVQQTVDAKETVSLSAPQTDAERKTGAVPSKISVVSGSYNANASSVSLQVVQYNANLLSVPNKKYSGVVQAQFSTAGDHTVLLTMANTAGTIGPRRTDTKPLNYTTSCKTGDYGTYTYTCPVSNKQIVHKCHGIRGNLMTYCPVLATVCSSVDLTNASVGLNLDGYTCAVSNMTTSLITCKCYPSTRRRLDTEHVLKETGVITACAMAQYTAYEVGETFQAAPELTSPKALERALIVIVMFTVLWAGGLTLITGCFIRQRQLHQESLERKLDDAGKQQQNSENSSVEEIRERLTKYVDSVFPVIFYPGHLLLRLKDEIRRNHRYLMMFMLLEGELEGKKRFINGIQLLTIQSALMFLLALLYDIQSPSDDGTCVSFTVQSDCLNRKSVFDSSRSYCQWTDTPDTGATNCSFNTSDVSFQATIYIQVLVSVASALIMRPLYYLFDVLLAPNVDNMKAKLAEEAALKSIENVGANRQSMVGRMTRRVGRVANSVASMIKFAQPKQVDPKDLENMPVTLIPDEVEMVHTQAKAYFRKLTQREQQYASNNGNSNPEHGRKSVRFTMMKKIQFTYNEYLGKIESEHTEAAEKKWDELKALIKEQRGLLKPEELAEYDAQWGLDPNTGEFLVASAQDKKSKDVEKLIQKEIALVERSTQATIDRLNLAVDSHVGLELLHKFILDILGRDTPAARIFGNKTAEDFRRSSVKTRREKVIAAILIAAANCLFVYYSILRGYVKGVDWQKSYLIACLVQMMLEIYLFETIECIWINVFVPSLVSSEVQRVNNLLLGIINDMCNKSIMGQKLIDDGKNYALDVTKYLFTSTRVAEVHPTLMESMMIRSYHTHLPGEISRKWTATGDQKVTSGCFSVSNHRENVSFPVAMIGSVILTLQIAAMTPFDIQKMFLRFVQPFLYGGLVLLGQDIVSNPIYIAITVVVLAVFAGLLLYQYWKSEAESEDTRMSKVQPISPVPVAEEAKPFDPRDADALAKKKEMEYLKQQRENLRQKANQWAISESKSHSSDSESNHGKEYNIRTAETAAAARRLNSGNKKSSVRKPAVPASASSVSQDGKDEKSGFHQWESSEEKSEMGAGESYMFSSSESPSKAQGNATNKDDDDDDLGLLHKPKVTSVAKSTTNGSNTRSAELDSFTSQSLDDSYHPVK